jgi:TIR domain/PASTA domain
VSSSPAPSPTTRGEIITFYSYKGGTGRTMALANVACLLAERVTAGQRILVVDWDLEAPGLHRFLPPRLSGDSTGPDLGLDAGKGLLDLFIEIASKLPPGRAKDEEAAEEAVEAALSSIAIESFVAATAVPGVSIMRAGRNDDGQYSRRVSTFDWEGLFHRAPPVYRAVAERLGEIFRYVLIDSRTGVTDISSICTSLLPQKLVVVFTPNRQSLTGVSALIESATKDRRNSDDLRPLLVYPLPSRIEASLQDLRGLWRLGSRDHKVVGYQPLFENLFQTCYGVARCDLSQYFDEVQIQQTPDYAYGEEIAVRRTADRFSLANSYRVFVDRLVSDAPPWASAAPPPAPAPLPRPSPPSAPRPSAPAPPAPAPPARRPSPSTDPKAAKPLRVFISYSPQDGERVRQIANAFDAQGFEVLWDRLVSAGQDSSNAIADTLDRSDVVIVCWSKASIGSEAVHSEAHEGLRRGVLIPVLLDDVVPPMGFRDIQSADLRRDFEGGMRDLVKVLGDFSPRSPGAAASPLRQSVTRAAPTARPASSSVGVWLALGTAAVVVLGAVFGIRSLLSVPQAVPTPSPAPTIAATPPIDVQVPNFVGSTTADARKVADILGLRVTLKDEKGEESATLEGVVKAQAPVTNQRVGRGAYVSLTVAATTVVVPTVVGMTLDSAVGVLARARLQLVTRGSRPVPDAKPGTIIEQTPAAGTSVAAGSLLSVIVATRAPRTTPDQRPPK